MSFEQFIIKCCRLDEWDLRTFLKEKLTEAGFTVNEDDYRSSRGGRYSEVHNLLAIRGNYPKVCLVAHTDVCRDHGFRTSVGITRKANPVIKTMDRFGKTIRIIQDEYCQLQVGGDDRLGVAINTWIALNTGHSMGLLFTTDEEIGALSADEVSFDELGEFELLVQVDRGNHSNQLVLDIYGTQLCNVETGRRLLQLAKEIDLPRYPVSGLLTDVYALKKAGKCKNAVNMTCGYHNSHSSSPNEYISISEACETLKYVNEIIKAYELEEINLDNYNIVDNELNSIEQLA